MYRVLGCYYLERALSRDYLRMYRVKGESLRVRGKSKVNKGEAPT